MITSNSKFKSLLLASVGVMLLLAGCQKAYYGTMEKFGYAKREILVDRVEDARDAQTEAKDQFSSALEHFTEVVGFTGGDLEEKYEKLKDQFEDSESKAKAVSKRIKDVESVAKALFNEWEDELEEYSSDELKRSSQKKLDETNRKYEKLIAAMKRAEDKIEPVLNAFRDQVLFLKHNLNAQAISSLQDEVVSVSADVSVLIKEMEASIAEANEFISGMVGQ